MTVPSLVGAILVAKMPLFQAKRPVDMGEVCLKGVWWPTLVTERSLEGIKNFDVKDDDVWIATWPKADTAQQRWVVGLRWIALKDTDLPIHGYKLVHSTTFALNLHCWDIPDGQEHLNHTGTHWVFEICQLILNNGDVDKVDREQQPLPMEFDVMPGDNAIPRYKAARSWKSPRVVITHVPKRLLPEQLLGGKGKVITVIRNLKDSIVSFHHFTKGMDPESSLTFEESLHNYLYSDKVQYLPWFDYVAEFWSERHSENYLLLKYEKMKEDTRGAVIQIADFLGRALSDNVVDKIVGLVTVKSMKQRYNVAGELAAPGTGMEGKVGAPNLMRKGIVGDWKNTFTVAQNERFDEYYREKMAGLDLNLDLL